MSTLILFNKPYGVLSQFTDAAERQTLASYIKTAAVYPAGRLDKDSEGLLLLTDDGRWQAHISSPKFKLPKCYWVQVEGIPSAAALTQLRDGLQLKDGPTRPALAELIDPPAALWPREPPVRFRAKIPTQWLAITIREGRNRQVRRMTAAIGHPTLRLVRAAIGDWQLGTLQPGESHVISLAPLPATPKTSTKGTKPKGFAHLPQRRPDPRKPTAQARNSRRRKPR